MGHYKFFQYFMLKSIAIKNFKTTTCRFFFNLYKHHNKSKQTLNFLLWNFYQKYEV